MTVRPMPLVRISEPFNAADWIFEIKYDGFRALAEIEGGSCRLISRNGHEFKQWGVLNRDVGQALRGRSAILSPGLLPVPGPKLRALPRHWPPRAIRYNCTNVKVRARDTMPSSRKTWALRTCR